MTCECYARHMRESGAQQLAERAQPSARMHACMCAYHQVHTSSRHCPTPIHHCEIERVIARSVFLEPAEEQEIRIADLRQPRSRQSDNQTVRQKQTNNQSDIDWGSKSYSTYILRKLELIPLHFLSLFLSLSLSLSLSVFTMST